MRKIRLVAVSLVPALLTACIIPFNGPGDIRRDIEAQTGRRYDRSFGLTVGRSGMALARWAVRHSGEDAIPLKGIKKVEIGIYEVKNGPSSPAALTPGDWPEWSPLVEIAAQDDGSVLVLSKEGKDEGSIRRLLFVVEDEEELVLVRLSGKLDTFIEEAITYALEEAERPELVEPVISDYRESLERR